MTSNLPSSWPSRALQTFKKCGRVVQIRGSGFLAVVVLLDCSFAALRAFLGAFWTSPSATWTSLGPSTWPPSATWTPLGPPNWPPSVSWTPPGRSKWLSGALLTLQKPPKVLYCREISKFWPFALEMPFKCSSSASQVPFGCLLGRLGRLVEPTWVLLGTSWSQLGLLLASMCFYVFLFASICFYLLPICFYLLLLASMCFCLLLFASTGFYLLLFAFIWFHLLLFAPICCY